MSKKSHSSRHGQIGLFEESKESSGPQAPESSSEKASPLAFRARPQELSGFVGQDKVLKRYPFLKSAEFPSLILWGPPGVGKTTLAYILAEQSDKDLYRFNAVLGGVNDLKKLIRQALEVKSDFGREAIIFIDEIHRFNKAQQDALLPYVEKGDFTLIGATTENPRSSVNRALLSRLQVIELSPLSHEDLLEILKGVAEKFSLKIEEKSLHFIADHSHGDARNALNLLELAYTQSQGNELLPYEDLKKIVLENAREYDRNQDRHYDVISAFIKSLRGTDPDAALLWLAVMLDGGEDPVFIARRLVIFASEDVGNADPSALQLAVSTLQAVQNIGMPEARINLAQATTYLASTYKSHASYMAINQAMKYVQERETTPVPDHLKNHPPKGAAPYLYPHSYEGHYVEQEYTEEETPHFYSPSTEGKEKFLKERLNNLKNRK